MEFRKLTPAEVEVMVAQGYDRQQVEEREFSISDAAPQAPADAIRPSAMSQGQAIKSTLKGNAGSLIGSGLGAGIGMALTAGTGGLAAFTVPLLAGFGGSLLGGKAQELVLPEEYNRELQEAAAQAYEEHPVTSTLANVIPGALLGGAKPSLSNMRLAFTGTAGKRVAATIADKAEKEVALRAATAGFAGGEGTIPAATRFLARGISETAPTVEQIVARETANAVKIARGNVILGNAIGVGGNAGLEASHQLYETGEIDLSELGKSALIGTAQGLVFTNPNFLGRKFNKHWKTPEEMARVHSEEVGKLAELHDDLYADAVSEYDAQVQHTAQQNAAAAIFASNQTATQEAIAFRAKGLETANAWYELNPTNFKKQFKKFYQKESGDAGDVRNAQQHNAMLDAMPTAERRLYAYEQALRSADVEAADRVKAQREASKPAFDQIRNQRAMFANEAEQQLAEQHANEKKSQAFEEVRQMQADVDAQNKAADEKTWQARIDKQIDDANKRRQAQMDATFSLEENKRAAEQAKIDADHEKWMAATEIANQGHKTEQARLKIEAERAKAEAARLSNPSMSNVQPAKTKPVPATPDRIAKTNIRAEDLTNIDRPVQAPDGDNPNRGTVVEPLNKYEQMADWFEARKIKTKGKLYGMPDLGITVGIYNGLVDAVHALVRGGMHISDAIAKVLGDAKAAGHQVNEDAFRARVGEQEAAAKNPVKQGVWDGSDIGDNPVTALRLLDGTILIDPSAAIHAQAFENLGVDPTTVQDGGFVRGTEYKTSGADTGRIVRQANAKKSLEQKNRLEFLQTQERRESLTKAQRQELGDLEAVEAARKAADRKAFEDERAQRLATENAQEERGVTLAAMEDNPSLSLQAESVSQSPEKVAALDKALEDAKLKMRDLSKRAENLPDNSPERNSLLDAYDSLLAQNTWNERLRDMVRVHQESAQKLLPTPPTSSAATGATGQKMPWEMTIDPKLTVVRKPSTDTRIDYDILYDGNNIGKAHIVKQADADVWQSAIALDSDRGKGLGGMAIRLISNESRKRIYQSFPKSQSDNAKSMWARIADGETQFNDPYHGPLALRFVDPKAETKTTTKPAPPAATGEKGEDSYVYHGTHEGAARNIQRRGLEPAAVAKDKPNRVVFSNTEQYAKSYADRKGGTRGTILRVLKSEAAETDPSYNSGKYREHYSESIITPERVEIKTPQGWVKLSEWNFDEKQKQPTPAPKPTPTLESATAALQTARQRLEAERATGTPESKQAAARAYQQAQNEVKALTPKEAKVEAPLDNTELDAIEAAMEVKVSNPGEREDSGMLSTAAELIKGAGDSFTVGNGFLKANRNGVYNGTHVLNALKNSLTPDEFYNLEARGLVKKFHNRLVHKDELASWIEEHGELVNTATYGMEGKVSEAKREYDRMTHGWFEPLGSRRRDEYNDYASLQQGDDQAIAHWSDADKAKAKRYNELNMTVPNEPRDTSPRATSHYESISAYLAKAAKHVKNAYTHLADTFRANPRMMEIPLENEYLGRKPEDYVIQQPNGKYMVNPNPHVGLMDTIHLGKLYATREEALQAAKNLHTNLQILDKLEEHGIRPKWAKSTQEALKNGTELPSNVQRVDVVIPQKEGKIVGRNSQGQVMRENPMWTPDPLHENFPNTLGWAMIQYKTGPNGEKIAVIAEAQSRWGQEVREAKKAGEEKRKQDPYYKNYAEDKDHPLLRDYNRLILKAAIEQARKEGATHIMVSDGETAMMTEQHDVIHRPKVGSYQVYNKEGISQGEYKYESEARQWIADRPNWTYKKVTQEMADAVKPSQEPGMRLNYDTILPDMLRQFTGEKGEKVSLGEHKNAYGNKAGVAHDEILARLNRGEITPEQYAEQVRPLKQNLRSNLVFRNPDGTPKTDVSGMLFDIRNVPERKPRLMGSHYAPEAIPDSHTPLPTGLSEHIASNSATAESVLRTLASDNGNPYQDFARELLARGDADGLKVRVLRKPGARSQYSSGKGEISLGDRGRGLSSEVVLEEIVHGLTTEKLPSELIDHTVTGQVLKQRMLEYLANPNSDARVKELVNVYLHAARKLKLETLLFGNEKGNSGYAGRPDSTQKAIRDNYYGTLNADHTETTGYRMSNLPEFIAGVLTDPEFRAILNKHDDTRVREQGAVRRVINAVVKFLGLEARQGSVLESAMKASEKLLSMKRRAEYTTDKDLDAFYAPQRNITGKLIKPTEDLNPGLLQKLGLVFTSANDKVRTISPERATALDRTWKRGENFNAIGQTLASDLKKFDSTMVDRIYATHREAFRSGIIPTFNSSAERAVSTLLKNYATTTGNLRLNSGMKINGRDPGVNKWYVPDMISTKVIETIMKNPASDTAEYYRQSWADYVMTQNPKLNRDDVVHNITNYISAMGGDRNNFRSTDFGAVRKAEGYGLPLEMRETKHGVLLDRYSRRFSKDLAKYIELESKPAVAKLFGLPDPNTGVHPTDNRIADSPEVKSAMQWVTGNFDNANHPALKAAVRTVSNAVLGAGTGIRDIAQIPLNSIPYMDRLSDFPAFARGVSNMFTHARAALEFGAVKPNIDRLRMGEAYGDGGTAVQKLDFAADWLRKLQGRELLENSSRMITFSVGKEMARDRIALAKSGDARAKKWFDRFGLLVDADITRLNGKELETALNKVAANFTDAVQGTYGPMGLPTWTQEGAIAPFASLQKFSIEKANTLYKDVWTPFRTGENRLPLLTYVFGAALTGTAIQQLNKILNNRKSQDPELDEALSTGNPRVIAEQMATLASLASFGGILGDAAKFGSDLQRGRTPRNPLSMPLATATSDLFTKLAQSAQAINAGENPIDVFTKATKDYITSHVQSLRMVSNRIDSDTLETKDKFRDLRVYNELYEDKRSQPGTSNPYTDLKQREFKRETDPAKAIAMLPELIKEAIAEANGDPFKLRDAFRRLKSNNYQTMPGLETAPLSFMRYLNYLKQTQGEEAAQERMIDYLKQNQVNKLKSAFVPSLN